MVSGTIYFIKVIKNTPELNVETIVKKKASKIYDNNDNFVKQLTMEDYDNVSYEDLPDVFINALISCEDVRYFMHEGLDLPRILSALKNDLTSMSLKEGASTLTQQLIKNMLLTNTKTIERKIQEVYLANHIEKIYSKKDILEFYCNYVCFDGVSHGVANASYKFFNKAISQLTLPEAALLAGVINAPSFYSPILNPKNANERKNVVLHLMNKHGYINDSQKEAASRIKVEDLLVKQENIKDSNVYPYQAYIDIVYKQILDKTGYDPYTTPMEIYTYMDSALQIQIEQMQENKAPFYTFKNDLQQFASTIIDNKSGAITAVFGGRNYQGQKLFNHAYDKLIQPASTIKVLLEYALAFEYLNYNNMEVLNDVPINYPNTNIAIHNVDHNYLGEITIADAIGYSRNTTAIATLEQVVNKISLEKVVEYLKAINLMDNGPFTYAYGLGGYTYGVSVTNLAAAYSMIARKGLYIEPLAIKKIKLLDGSDKVIEFTPSCQKVLQESTCYLLIDVLKQVMETNYWSISDCRPKNVLVFAKTGTTSFDDNMLKKYNFPSNASKDRWLASFTSDYTIAAWTGFDEYIKGAKTYFTSSNNESHVVKDFTKAIYERISQENKYFTKPNDLVEVKIVKGSNLLATPEVNENYVVKALYKKGFEPTTYFTEPIIEDQVIYDYFVFDNQINFILKQPNNNKTYHKIFDYEQILDGKLIYLDIYENGFYQQTIQCQDIESLPLKKKTYYHFDLYFKYKNGLLNGPKTSLDFTYN